MSSLNDDEKSRWFIDFLVPAFVIISKSAGRRRGSFPTFLGAMPQFVATMTEPMMNIISWRKGDEYQLPWLFLREHRPEALFAEGDAMVVRRGPGHVGLIAHLVRKISRKLTEEKTLASLQGNGVSGRQDRSIITKLQSI